MKDCFVAQEAAVVKRLDEVATAEHLWDTCISNLEETSTGLDKSFTKWRPPVDSSISTVNLELSKLNSFFDCDMRTPGSSSHGVLHAGSAYVRPPAGIVTDDPAWHLSENSN
jgi:hypothetical protein